MIKWQLATTVFQLGLVKYECSWANLKTYLEQIRSFLNAAGNSSYFFISFTAVDDFMTNFVL